MKKITLTLFMLCLAFMAYAVPAQRVAHVVKQADGTELTVYLVGDEFLHYYTTADEVPVALANDGSFYYATLSDEGRLTASATLAHDKALRSVVEQQIVAANIQGGIKENLNLLHQAKAMRAKVMERANSGEVLPEGEVNVPVLLVEYADLKFTFTKELFEQMLNEEGYDAPTYYSNVRMIGSARDYFRDQSNGKFIPKFVVSDIVTASQDMAYYGGNDASGNDLRVTYLVKEACLAMDEKWDFSIFDNNKDGEVEFIYCIYAGHNEAISGADPNTIWPHKWYLSAQGNRITLDGVIVDEYACSSECFGLPRVVDANGKHYINGYGAMCHEFSHCLGLPDFYDTGGGGNYGMNVFSIMDSGCYNAGGYVPVGYTAYEKDFLGWIDAEELTVPEKYTLEPLIHSNKAYKIINDKNPNEYYMLEYRIKESWDAFMPGEGLMITHVDYDANAWYRNTVNNDASRQRMCLISPEKLTSGSNTGAFWPYNGKNALTDETTPAATVYTGGFMGKPITNITNENGAITFSFMGGVHVDTPTVLPATDITETGFTANWIAADGAKKYNVDLYKLKNVGDTGELDEDKYIDPLDALQGAPAEDYAGSWKIKSTDGTNEYETTATISVLKSGTKTYLQCKGFTSVRPEYNYDDTFLIEYNATTGLLNLPAQYVESFVYQGDTCQTVLYLTDSKASTLFGGSLVGGFKDGKIVLLNADTNNNIADSFAFIFQSGEQYYLLSRFIGLEWAPAGKAAAKAPAMYVSVEQPQRIMRAEAQEEVETLLYEDFSGFTDTGKSMASKCDNYFSVPGWSGSNLYSEGGKMRIGTASIAGNATTPLLTSNKRVVVSMMASLYDSADTGVAMTFSYVKDGEEIEICTRKVKEAGKVQFSFLPGGDFQLKITTKNSTGKKRVVLSQFTVSERLGVQSQLIRSVETAETSYAFTGLETNTEYKYCVSSIDEEGNKSEASEFEFVVLGTVETAIDVVEVDSSADGIYDLAGRKIDTPERGGIYIVRKGNSLTKILVK